MQEICAHHLLELAKLCQCCFIHAAVNLNQRNRLAAYLLATKMECRNIDPMGTAQRAKIADKAGLVIAKIEQMLGEI